MLEKYIGKFLVCDFDLFQQNDNTIRLFTKGEEYQIIDIDGHNNFLLKNDAGRFDIISCTNFIVPNED